MTLKRICFISAVLAVCGVIPQRGYAEGLSTQIVISREHKPRPIEPRCPEQTVIECFYDDESKSLQFQYLEDIGGATAVVVNTTTGESSMENSSTPGACYMTISGEAGTYSIQIEDGDGNYYTGSFDI